MCKFIKIQLEIIVSLILINFTISYNSGPYYYLPPYNNGQKYEEINKNIELKNQLISVFEAKSLEFGFPTEHDRLKALKDGNFKPDSAIPIDVDVFYATNKKTPQKIFITIPRFDVGIPYSLAYLTDEIGVNGTRIQPYPNYNWHRSHGEDCNGLTSIYRVQIDSCGQMWVLDSGEIGFKQFCPPQLIVFDLKRDKTIYRYNFLNTMYKTNVSRFVTPVVDVLDPAPYGKCKKAFIYMADPTGFGFVVHDFAEKKSWRIENKYTYPDPEFSTHTIAGESFELLDGVFSFALTPLNLDIERMLYFHSLSNDLQVSIPLNIVNNASYWTNDISSALDQFIPLGKRKVHCGASAITSNGILLCGYYKPIGIFGWDIQTPFTSNNRKLLIENSETLQFVSGLKVIKNHLKGTEEVWALSNRLQKAFSGTVNFNETNFRIQRCGVEELLNKKPCKE